MASASEKIVVVDESAKTHAKFRRLLTDKYELVSFKDPDKALAWLKSNSTPAAVVSGFDLGDTDGISFSKAVDAISTYSARIILTEDASTDFFRKALNTGHVFSVLVAPLTDDDVITSLEAAVGYHRRLVHDRNVLERTLAGSVKLLIDMLSQFHADAFRRTGPMRQNALRLAKAMGIKKTWELEMAVMLSPLGEALLPKEILSRYRAAKPLTEQQREVLADAPRQTRDLLKNIPQLERVAEVLYLSGRGFDGSGFPKEGPVGQDIPLNARILRLLTDLWVASPEAGADAATFEALKIRGKAYDPDILRLAKRVLLDGELKSDDKKITLCYVRNLREGDVLVDDVLTETSHELVLARGHELTETTIRRLDQYNRLAGVRQPIRVHRPEMSEGKMAAAV